MPNPWDKLRRKFRITAQGNIQVPKHTFKQVPGEDPSKFWEFEYVGE